MHDSQSIVFAGNVARLGVPEFPPLQQFHLEHHVSAFDNVSIYTTYILFRRELQGDLKIKW